MTLDYEDQNIIFHLLKYICKYLYQFLSLSFSQKEEEEEEKKKKETPFIVQESYTWIY